MMRVVIAGPDADEIGEAFGDLGHDVTYVAGTATRETLLDAGIETADVLVVTDMTEATAIPVAHDENPGVRIVTYARESLPEFARGQADLAVDPSLLAPDVVAEEVTASVEAE